MNIIIVHCVLECVYASCRVPGKVVGVAIGEGRIATVQRSAAPIHRPTLLVTGLFCEKYNRVQAHIVTIQLNKFSIGVLLCCPIRSFPFPSLILPHENSISRQIGCCRSCRYCCFSAQDPHRFLSLQASHSKKAPEDLIEISQTSKLAFATAIYTLIVIRCVGRQFYGGHIGSEDSSHCRRPVKCMKCGERRLARPIGWL